MAAKKKLSWWRQHKILHTEKKFHWSGKKSVGTKQFLFWGPFFCCRFVFFLWPFIWGVSSQRHFVLYKSIPFFPFPLKHRCTSYALIQFAMSMKSKYAKKVGIQLAYYVSTGVFLHFCVSLVYEMNFFWLPEAHTNTNTCDFKPNCVSWKVIILWTVHGTTKLIKFFPLFIATIFVSYVVTYEIIYGR